jgi:hypothetical protein
MQMAAGAAPNLLDVHVKEEKEDATDEVFFHRISAPVQDLFVGYPKTASALRSLRLVDPDSLELGRRNRHIDFSSLEMLQVIIDISSLTLTEVTKYHFACLQSLILRFNCWVRDTDERFDRVARLDHDASILLLRLPPLKRFLLECYYAKECVDRVLKHHGKTLEKLGIIFRNHNDPFRVRTTPELINKIRIYCPVLQDLTLRIPRSKGDAAEVSIYRALGKITTLRYLDIQLDFSRVWPPQVLDLFLASVHCSADDPIVRETLINAAVDESLIRSILAIVALPDVSLRALRVETVLGVMPRKLAMMAEFMQSVWEADFSLGGISVRKTDSWVKRRELSSGTKFAEYEWLEEVSCCSKPFRSLWPAKGGRWVDDWHSFPLQLD